MPFTCRCGSPVEHHTSAIVSPARDSLAFQNAGKPGSYRGPTEKMQRCKHYKRWLIWIEHWKLVKVPLGRVFSCVNLDDERLPISVLRSKRFAIRQVKLQQTKESKDVILRHDGGIHLDTPYFFFCRSNAMILLISYVNPRWWTLFHTAFFNIKTHIVIPPPPTNIHHHPPTSTTKPPPTTPPPYTLQPTNQAQRQRSWCSQHGILGIGARILQANGCHDLHRLKTKMTMGKSTCSIGNTSLWWVFHCHVRFWQGYSMFYDTVSIGTGFSFKVIKFMPRDCN